MTAPVVVLDTETTGLDPRADRLVLVGFAIDGAGAVLLRHDHDREHIQAFLDLEHATFCGHNLTFDLGFIEAAGYRIPPPERWVDTVLMAHVAGERLPGQTALARLTAKLIELGELPEAILEPEAAIRAWLAADRRQARKDGRRRPEKGDAPESLLRPYLHADLDATAAVLRHYGGAINGQGPVLELERRCMPAIYATERRGVPLDLEAATELRDRTAVTVDDLRARLVRARRPPVQPQQCAPDRGGAHRARRRPVRGPAHAEGGPANVHR